MQKQQQHCPAFRAGDIVSVEAKVRFDSRGDDLIFLEVGASSFAVEPAVVTLARPYLKTGELVMYGAEVAEVIATHENSVWIKGESWGHRLVHITDLKRKAAAAEAAL